MSVTRLRNGAYEITAIVNGYLVRRIYLFYTRREAVSQFNAEFPNQE